MSASLGELAVRFGCELRGDPDARVERVAPLAEAGPDALAFFANARFRRELATTRAGAVVLDAGSAASCSRPLLIAPNPYATYARIAAVLHPAPAAPAGIHPTAFVAARASVAVSAHVGPHVAIGHGARLGERVVVGAGCVIEEGADLGDDVRLVARVYIGRDVRVGPRTIVQPGAVIGGDGFGFAPERGAWVKVPQVGSVVIGADVEIGSNTTIDRGAIGDTVLEDGVKLDNQIQIGHNVRVGAHTAMAACVGVSGSTTIGKRCQIAGMAGIAGHLSICDDVVVTGLTMISHSITAPGVYSSGIPGVPAREWRRTISRMRQLDDLATRLNAMARRLGLPRDSSDGDAGKDAE
jgi:UDP-3-O-[3-hydroxymyristoyl] glucosamine N-acyltransferase